MFCLDVCGLYAVFFEFGCHLLLHFACLVACHFGVELGVVGIDDAARCVDEQSAVFVHAVLAYFFEASSLCAYAWNEQEVVGCDAPDVL